MIQLNRNPPSFLSRVYQKRAKDLQPLVRALRLRCPACGIGHLFYGWFQMRPACMRCGFCFAREPGFYLGSIYINYGATVILTGLLYTVIVLGLGFSNESALAACLTVTSVFPIFFFRYARSFLLAFDSCVNWHQSQASQPSDASELDGGGLSAKHLAGLKKDDASAAYAMGMGLALIILFGLLMAVATIYFVGTISFEPDPLSESI